MSYEMNEKNGEIPALEDVEVRKGQAGEMTESPVDELQALDKNINSMKACIDSCGSVVDRICAGVTAWKEIDNLDKYKSRIPVIEKQLDAVNSGLGKILDYVIAMDAKTEAEMEMKMRMMERIDLFLNTISTTMMNLL